MKKAIIISAVALALCAAGCGHNTGAFTIGTRVNFGLDPANATANVSYTDGLNVLDVSRENSEWELEIDADTGLSVDSKTGNVKGVKRIKRKIGIQITGYLVELAKENPDLAKLYIERMIDKK
jgi:hypothetical protein